MIADALEFLRGVREELKKVVWPSKELIVRATVAVIIFTALFSVYLWILDTIFAKMITLVFNKL
jgi:preprotein translocase subunit SecE